MSMPRGAVASLHGSGAAPPDVLGWLPPALLVSLTVGCYLVAASRYRARRARTWGRWRTASWLTGAVLVGLSLSPPAEAAASQVTGHMAQHLVLGMIAPLALVLGAPVTLLLATAPPEVGRRVSGLLRTRLAHAVTHPVAAAVLNVGGMFVLYLTPLLALSTSDETVHHTVHLHFLAAGYLYCWSIAGPDPAPGRPRLRTRLLVLVLAAGAHSYLATLLYARAGELPPGSAATAAEVEAAAQLMYYGGDVAEVLLAVALFAGWYRLAARGRGPGGARRPILHFVALRFSTEFSRRDCPP